jgi:hypothetical protein
VHECRAGLGRVAHEHVLRVRGFLAVGDQGPVVAVGEGDGDRGVPAVRHPGQREIDALLAGQDLLAAGAVVVVAEDRGQGGPEAEAGGGDRQVGDAARAAAHARRPDLLARRGRLAQSREDEIVEEQPGQQDLGPVVVHAGILSSKVFTFDDRNRAPLGDIGQYLRRTEHGND